MSAAALAAAVVLSMPAADDTAQPPLPPRKYVCPTSEAERIQAREARGRVLEWPSTDFFGDVESRIPIAGCGIWALTVSPAGEVLSARILRSDVDGTYDGMVRPWISHMRFRPSPSEWTALMSVEVKGPTD